MDIYGFTVTLEKSGYNF